MQNPKRIHHKRGVKFPHHTKSVTRSSRWGNPYKEKDGYSRAEAVELFKRDLLSGKLKITVEDIRRELKGWNLACCPLDGLPCHGDVLLEIANQDI